MVAGKNSHATYIKINNEDEGSRVCEISTSKHPMAIRVGFTGFGFGVLDPQIDLMELGILDALEYLMLDIN